jgi:hypothetical protein
MLTLLLGQLRAKEDIHRQQAASIIKSLADHCSDPNEMGELIKYLFGVLSGRKKLSYNLNLKK